MAIAAYNITDIPTKRELLELQRQIDELKKSYAAQVASPSAEIAALKKKLSSMENNG